MSTPIYSSSATSRMENVALSLSVIALISSIIIYISVPAGALAVIFASLSRGGRTQISAKSTVAMILGIVAIVFTLLLYGTAFAFLMYQYGSIDGIMQAYSSQYGIDINSILQ